MMDLIAGINTIRGIPHLILFIIGDQVVIMLGLSLVTAQSKEIEKTNEGGMFAGVLKILFFCNSGKPKDFAGAKALKLLVRNVVVKDGFHDPLYHRRAYAC